MFDDPHIPTEKHQCRVRDDDDDIFIVIEHRILFVFDKILEDNEAKFCVELVGDTLIFVLDVFDEALRKTMQVEPLQDCLIVNRGEDHLFLVVIKGDFIFAVETIGKKIHGDSLR